MDSLTHIALGAVIGEAKLGRQAGYKAALWGAAVSTFPDLDVLLNPFLESAHELRFHRGFTHSFTFMFLASPLFGWLIHRFHKDDDIGWKPWAWLSFWTLLSHILIDVTTSYGTQIFEPFSSYPATTDSMFIIDPIYTSLLIAGIIVALLQKNDSKLRVWTPRIALILSSLYVFVGFGIKAHVNQVFDTSFNEQHGNYDRMKTIPGPFTTLLWMGYIERNDSLYVSTYSLFDDDYNLRFKGIAKNSGFLEPWLDDYPVEVLNWFSMGYYKMEKSGNNLYLHDLRFGRSDFWLTNEANYIWTNRFIFNEDSTSVIDFDRSIPIIDSSVDNREQVWDRFLGVKPDEIE
jgi:inner membrane protein